MNDFWKRAIFLALLTVGLLPPSRSAFAAEPLLFGIVPQQSASRLAEMWTPFMVNLEKKTGLSIVFRTATDIPTFEKRLAEGEYDFAYMNPYHYTVFHRQPGYNAFAKEKGKQIEGILVVRKDSPRSTIRDLDGQTLAFPSPAAFAASVLPRSALKKNGISFTPKFVASHDSVYRSVAAGLFPAGGGIVRTFNGVEKKIRDQLRVLWRTGGYTPHAFAVHPRVPPEAVKAVLQAMLEMNDDRDGQSPLGKVALKAIEPATDSDWDDIRDLGINLLDPLVQE